MEKLHLDEKRHAVLNTRQLKTQLHIASIFAYTPKVEQGNQNINTKVLLGNAFLSKLMMMGMYAF